MTAALYRFSESDEEMDRPLIHRWLSTESYWALARTRELHDRAMCAGGGVGVALIRGITDLLEPLALKRMALVTADAHGLYEKFGFESLAEPERWMARLRG